MFLHPRIFSILYSHSFQTRSRILIVVSCIFYMELFGIQTILPASVGRSFSPILAYDEGTKFRCLKLKTRMIGHLIDYAWILMVATLFIMSSYTEAIRLINWKSHILLCFIHKYQYVLTIYCGLLIPYLFAIDLGECTSIFTANDHGACFWKILT